jgi:hypothetical protein
MSGGDCWIKIYPLWIAFLDQPDFPIPPPFLQFFLARNRRQGVVVDFEPDQLVDRISSGEAGDGLSFVLVDATDDVIRYAEIKRAVFIAC